jgi:DNA polymerase-1
MELRGIRVDAAALRALSTEFTDRLAHIEQRAHTLAGEEFNLGSTKQLGALFFDKLGYPVIKKTKTGYSTDHEVLETLARDYELPAIVLEHRTLAKLKSTYIDGLLKVAHPQTQRVHTTYNQAGAATGRLSSNDPNLQNIPIRTEEGRRIRSAFVAEEGWELISADYSQIELRVMAHFSGDESFVGAFERGEDIHRRTAMEVLTEGEEPDPEARRRAKAINFGILYGLSAFGLSRNLGISNADANAYIKRYFARYPGIRRFLDQTIADAARTGYVTTLLGRRRFVPDIKSRNRTVRQAAERVAMNTPIQGTAADLIKLAMVRVANALTSRRLQARLLLQVHDELVLEAPQKERSEVVDLVRREMSQVMQLAVPLVVDVAWGESWTAAHA